MRHFAGSMILWWSGLLGILTGCERETDSPSVVVYVSADRAVALPILEAFTRQTGIEVRPLFDTEATKTTGLANRVRRERSRPRADVFWSSEPFAVEQLAAEGLLQPTAHPDLDGHPSEWRRIDDRWFAFAGRARVIAFDPERLSIEDCPQQWTDLADPRWKGQIAMADPRFGTTRGHFGAIAASESIGDPAVSYPVWLDGLAANGIQLLTGGNAATVDAVVRGEVLLGLTDSDDVRAARRRGARVESTAPRHLGSNAVGGGTLLIPNAVGMVTGARHPNAASALVAFLASAEVERLLYRSPSGNQPLAHPLDEGERMVDDGPLAEDPWRISISSVAEVMDGAVDRAMDAFSLPISPGDGR